MTQEESVLTKEQCENLLALGLDMSDASCHYLHRDCDDICFVESYWHDDEDVYTYTFQEVLSKLCPEFRKEVIEYEPEEWMNGSI